jgi:hypothetical protein
MSSSSAATDRKTYNIAHKDKTDIDKKKHISRHTGTMNGTHGKTETHKHTTTRRKSEATAHGNVHSKSDTTKKHTSVDKHTKVAHTGIDF